MTLDISGWSPSAPETETLIVPGFLDIVPCLEPLGSPTSFGTTCSEKKLLAKNSGTTAASSMPSDIILLRVTWSMGS